MPVITTTAPVVPDQVVSLGFGKANFKVRNIAVNAWHVEGPWSRELPSKRCIRQGNMQQFPASEYPEVNGRMWTDTVRAPEGSFFLIQVSKRMIVRAGSMPLMDDGALLLRTRAAGPLISVQANMPDDPRSRLQGLFLVFQGRADIMTPEVAGMYGIEPPSSYIETYMDEAESAECFRISELSPAANQLPRLEVTEVAGQSVVLPARRMRRVTRR